MEKLNINTAEGWNQYAAAMNRKSFINEFGREPIDSAEVTAWVNAVVAEINALHPIVEKKPDPTLEIMGGEMFWVTRL